MAQLFRSSRKSDDGLPGAADDRRKDRQERDGEFLNEEYAELCCQLALALAKKRPSPLLRGRPETWACGIVRTIGWVHYLDDSSHKPHLKLLFIDRAFGVAESTGQGKSKSIRTMVGIQNFDPRWTLPSRIDDYCYRFHDWGCSLQCTGTGESVAAGSGTACPIGRRWNENDRRMQHQNAREPVQQHPVRPS